MLATSGDLPTTAGWAYEIKWDGVRVLAEVRPDRGLTLRSRNGNDVTVAYPELAGLAEVLPDGVLDGEVVALDDGRPSFAALGERMGVRDAAAARRLAASRPVVLMVFDLLRLYGVDLTDRPWQERRATLERLGLDGPSWTTPPAFDDGAATTAASRDLGLEGVVAKRVDAPYRPGERSPAWVKVKAVRHQEAVVGGWRAGEGGRSGRIGSLLVGLPDADGLRYAGRVGSGLSGVALADLTRRLAPLHRPDSPFAAALPTEDARGVTWCAPVLVVEVAFDSWTPGGRLRHPRYRGLRLDKHPEEVRREP